MRSGSLSAAGAEEKKSCVQENAEREMKTYKCLFFDLDRTLWDVETNQREAQRILYEKYGLERYCPGFDAYFDAYLEINDRLWLGYRDGTVTREYLRNHRFTELLGRFGVRNLKLAIRLGNDYIRLAPTFRNLMPHARETVEYLYGRGYPMDIVTNGFDEVQHVKLANCGLGRFFRHVICSEKAGANKPDPRIFRYALRKAGVGAGEALMIGDDPENDMEGAIGAGIDTVYYHPTGTPHGLGVTWEIRDLSRLREIL